jgi:hypothetical protein
MTPEQAIAWLILEGWVAMVDRAESTVRFMNPSFGSRDIRPVTVWLEDSGWRKNAEVVIGINWNYVEVTRMGYRECSPAEFPEHIVEVARQIQEKLYEP